MAITGTQLDIFSYFEFDAWWDETICEVHLEMLQGVKAKIQNVGGAPHGLDKESMFDVKATDGNSPTEVGCNISGEIPRLGNVARLSRACHELTAELDDLQVLILAGRVRNLGSTSASTVAGDCYSDISSVERWSSLSEGGLSEAGNTLNIASTSQIKNHHQDQDSEDMADFDPMSTSSGMICRLGLGERLADVVKTEHGLQHFWIDEPDAEKLPVPKFVQTPQIEQSQQDAERKSLALQTGSQGVQNSKDAECMVLAQLLPDQDEPVDTWTVPDKVNPDKEEFKRIQEAEDNEVNVVHDSVDAECDPLAPLVLDAMPAMRGLQEWRLKSFIECCKVSSFSRQQTLDFLEAVDAASSPSDIRLVPPEWENFDTLLYEAVERIAVVNFRRELNLYRERCFATSSPPFGRVALWMLFQRYVLPKGFQKLQNFNLARELKCRDDIEEFLLEYETLQLRCEQNNISPELWDVVLTDVKNQLEKYFHGTLLPSQDYQVSELLKMARRKVMSDRMDSNRKAMQDEPLVNQRDEFTGAFRERARQSKNKRRRRGRGSRRSCCQGGSAWM